MSYSAESCVYSVSSRLLLGQSRMMEILTVWLHLNSKLRGEYVPTHTSLLDSGQKVSCSFSACSCSCCNWQRIFHRMEPNSQRMEEGIFTNIGIITAVSLLPDVNSMWITCALLVDTQLLRCGVSLNRLAGEQPARRKVRWSRLFSLPRRPNVTNEPCPTPNGHSPLPLSRGVLLNGTCGDAAMVRRWYYVVWLWGAPATYASVAPDYQRYRNAAQEGCWCRRTEDPHFLT